MIRLMYYTKKDLAEEMAIKISKDIKVNCDQIPPAYPCENEKLLVIVAELKSGHPDRILVDFCKTLVPRRTRNVAFATIGKGDLSGSLKVLQDVIKQNGVNVVENVYDCQVDSSLFKKAALTDEDIKKGEKWLNDVIEALA